MKITRNVDSLSAGQVESKNVQNESKVSQQPTVNSQVSNSPARQVSAPEKNTKLTHLELEGTTKQFSLKTKLTETTSEPVFKDVKLLGDPTTKDAPGPCDAVGPCGVVGPCSAVGPCNATGPCD